MDQNPHHALARAARFALTVMIGSILSAGITHAQDDARWSRDRAVDWYRQLPWLVGCNFIPSTAINQLEMWQADTFDPSTIDRELGWAASLGMNTARVYLHDLAWEHDPSGFRSRLDTFLSIAKRHGIRPILVFFDDCWNEHPAIGRQPAPIPGVHNSGWMQSPGKMSVNDSSSWPRLERYVKDVLNKFSHDSRILMWDLYNEPGNSSQGSKSLPFLRRVFAWAREVDPSQPITSGIWGNLGAINSFQLAASDIITFHNYNDTTSLVAQIDSLKQLDRPLICTEWLRRTGGSLVQTHLPIFARERVGACNWGLVSGKTQTIYPWGSKEGSPEPSVWFHDLFHTDGKPFDAQEAEVFRRLKQQGTSR